jgi:hypothetical protein
MNWEIATFFALLVGQVTAAQMLIRAQTHLGNLILKSDGGGARNTEHLGNLIRTLNDSQRSLHAELAQVAERLTQLESRLPAATSKEVHPS